MTITNDADGFRCEAATQFGFIETNDDADQYACGEDALIAFAKACERKGLAEALEMVRHQGDPDFIAFQLNNRIAAIDAELKPVLEAERLRFLKRRGIVPELKRGEEHADGLS